jgi:hypothetical protein
MEESGTPPNSFSAESAAALALYLRDRDAPCPGCGYNLRGVTLDRCPECNRSIELGVRLTHDASRAWAAGMAGTFAPAICAGAELALVTFVIIREGSFPPRDASWFILYIPVGAVISGGVLTALLWKQSARRWLEERGNAGRVRFVVCCWLFAFFWAALEIGGIALFAR